MLSQNPEWHHETMNPFNDGERLCDISRTLLSLIYNRFAFYIKLGYRQSMDIIICKSLP